jgi:hypothetical protein
VKCAQISFATAQGPMKKSVLSQRNLRHLRENFFYALLYFNVIVLPPRHQGTKKITILSLRSA